MKALAEKFIEFIKDALEIRLFRGTDNRVQPVILGPPTDVMEEVFNIMTNNNTSDWVVGDPENPIDIVVLLVYRDIVSSQPDSMGKVLSQKCNWDYAVSIRNSGQPCVTLVIPRAWDSRPESIANATETIGSPRISDDKDFYKKDPWPFLVGSISNTSNVSETEIHDLLSIVQKEALNRTEQRESALWDVVDQLIQATQAEDIVKSVGLPNLGNQNLTQKTLKDSNDILSDLAKFCAKTGLRNAENELREGAISLCIERPLKELFSHLRDSAGSGTTFNDCPAWYFRPVSNSSDWWDHLPYEKIQKLLEEIGESRPTGRLELSCQNALNRDDLIKDEPLIVENEVDLQVRDNKGDIPRSVDFSRKIGRQYDSIYPEYQNGNFIDASVPDHQQVVAYKTDSDLYRPGTLKLISLSSFQCRGHARISDAVSNPPPVLQRGSGVFEQEITLQRIGTHEMVVFSAPEVSVTTIEKLSEDSPHLSSPDRPATFTIDVEHNDIINISTLGQDGQTLGNWTLRILVEESLESAPRTRFESLVRAHQENRGNARPVRPTVSEVRRLEESYLQSQESWKGMVACWSTTTKVFEKIDWTQRCIGNIPLTEILSPDLDKITPPTSYLSKREDIRQKLETAHRTIGEINLDDQNLIATATDYLNDYLVWLKQKPEVAVWTDCIAIHAPSQNIQAGQVIATGEPIGLLLSPLHPLRFAWHCHSQHVLQESLSTKRCPAAGLLDPSACPALFSLPLYRGETQAIWRTFVTVGCNEPHWLLLWNVDHIGDSEEKRCLISILINLGIIPTGLSGGFTGSQTQRALEEVSSILSARASLRVGFIGGSEESFNCVDGLIEWCTKHFHSDEEEDKISFPSSCEVYDLRDNPSYPSAAKIADLSEETRERVRWFSIGTKQQSHNMDLVVLDQVGTLDPNGIRSTSKSLIANGALMRFNTRQDIGNGSILQDSRASRYDGSLSGIEEKIVKTTTTLENLAKEKGDISHIEFRPNQQAIGSRLDQSMFVAATSSQIDPACFIRGAGTHDAYLWDYELPETLGFDENQAGYYLIAKPSDSMKDAILASARLITSASLRAESLLEEISKRGIPVLKQLASGGTSARGELGVLLAVRLIQDAFRQGGSGIRLPVITDECMHVLLPVDSYWKPLSQFRKILDPKSSHERPDILVIAIHFPKNEQVRVKVKITPVEVKFRNSTMPNGEVRQALRQAENLGGLLRKIWGSTPENELWSVCSKSLLCQCLEHAFRIYADSNIHGLSDDEWTKKHEDVLHDILTGQASIIVNQAGRLLVFDQSNNTSINDMDGDGQSDTAILSSKDADYLLSGNGSLSPKAQNVVRLLDFSFSECISQQTSPSSTGTGDNRSEVIEPIETRASSADLAGEITVQEPEETNQSGDQISELQEKKDSTSPVPSEVRELVRQAFDGFIGNEPAVKRVSNDLLRALIEKPPHLPKNYLFTGLPSTGKTEFARRIAKALRLPFVQLDGRGVGTRERLFDLVKGELNQQDLSISQVGQQSGLPLIEYPPLIIFIDEVHLVPKSVQESLLTMLEAMDRTVILSDQVAKMNKATFLFATTRASQVDAAFRSRCAEVQLREYTKSEVAEILRRRISEEWPEDIHLEIAKLGRCVPRVAIELARELETEITVSEHPERSLEEHLEEVQKAREIDVLGLTLTDRQYLTVLEKEGKPVGEKAIINILGAVDKDRIINEIEPFLRRLGFIKLGGQGREITPEGIDYILSKRREE